MSAVGRVFMADDLLEWEAYVSGGKPGSARGAAFYFVCLTKPVERPRYVPHPSRDPATAERELRGIDDAELRKLFRSSQPIL